MAEGRERLLLTKNLKRFYRLGVVSGAVVFKKPIRTLGFEPRQTESESIVLPLHHAPVDRDSLTSISISFQVA